MQDKNLTFQLSNPTKKMTNHFAINLHMCQIIENKQKKITLCSLKNLYLLCLFLENTLNQTANGVSNVYYNKQKLLNISYSICSSEQKNKEKPFPFIFSLRPYYFYTFQRRKSHIDFKTS